MRLGKGHGKALGKALALGAALLAAGGLSGCGEESCPSEPVAKVEEAESCTVAPGATVTVGVRLCPTCNQTGASCAVDVQGDVIQLDLVAEACESVTSCPSPTPSCQVNPLACTFQAPAVAGEYDVLVYDPSTGTFPVVATLTVAPGPTSCAFSASSAP